MSLLMEALRKAEEAKRRMQQEEQAAGKDPQQSGSAHAQNSPGGFTLEERPPQARPDYLTNNTPGADDQDAAVDPYREQATDSAAVEPEPLRQSAEDVERAARTIVRRQQRAAASVFEAKQNPARNRKTLTILVIAMMLMIPLGGGVLWYLQSAVPASIGINPAIANYDLSARAAVAENSAPPAATAATAEASPANTITPAVPEANAPASEQPATEVETSVANTTSENVTPEVAAEDASASAVAEVPSDTGIAATEATPPAAAPVVVAANADSDVTLPETDPATGFEVSRSRSTSQVNPDLVSAYERLQAGDLLVAGQLYQEVLTRLPNNRDAMLGSALVYLRQGAMVRAREQYARLLQLNPRDPLAQTGLLQTMQVTDPAEHESALKALRAEYPDVAQLDMALGNLYASQQRWSEAQGAYYNALLSASRNKAGPVHPDYAFNLAVSLEQLNEPKAALDYYRQAQTLAREVTPGFDPQLLNSRLAYLEQAQP